MTAAFRSTGSDGDVVEENFLRSVVRDKWIGRRIYVKADQNGEESEFVVLGTLEATVSA